MSVLCVQMLNMTQETTSTKAGLPNRRMLTKRYNCYSGILPSKGQNNLTDYTNYSLDCSA